MLPILWMLVYLDQQSSTFLCSLLGVGSGLWVWINELIVTSQKNYQEKEGEVGCFVSDLHLPCLESHPGQVASSM